MDKFAKQGTRFDQAHTSYTVCTQSRVAFMTAWPTHVAGHRGIQQLLHDWEPNLMKYMLAAGYEVMWWGKNDLIASDSWNSTVTEARSMGSGAGGSKVAGKNMTDPRYYTFLHTADPRDPTDIGTFKNTDAAIQYIKNRKKDDPPFFVYIPLVDPHPPYSAPEPWYSSVDPATVPDLRPVSHSKPDYHRLIRKYRNLN